MRGRRLERLLDSPWRWLLLPLWLLWRPLVGLRSLAYDRRLAPRRRLPVPVLSVGNLSAGGTGKTPLVALLAARCRQRGLRPAALSRGYRGAGGTNDEARMLDLPVVCDPQRWRGGQRALADGATCLILDDGFQHRRLHRDLDLVLIDATRPWGSARGRGAVMPLGFLREGRGALARADAIVVTRCDQVPPAVLATLLAELGAGGQPVLRAHHRAVALLPLHGGPAREPTSLAGRPVLLACGLGNPAGFERTAAGLGWDVRGSLRFADHAAYRAEDAAELAAASAAADATLVITAKDAVKLRPLLSPAVPCLVLEVAMTLDPADEAPFEALLDRALRR